MLKSFQGRSGQKGVVLIETMVAVLIFSIGVLGIVGLQAAMVKNTADAKFRADAANIAQARIGRMWADPSNLATYVETNTDISSQIPNGRRTVVQNAAGDFTITVTWLPSVMLQFR